MKKLSLSTRATFLYFLFLITMLFLYCFFNSDIITIQIRWVNSSFYTLSGLHVTGFIVVLVLLIAFLIKKVILVYKDAILTVTTNLSTIIETNDLSARLDSGTIKSPESNPEIMELSETINDLLKLADTKNAILQKEINESTKAMKTPVKIIKELSSYALSKNLDPDELLTSVEMIQRQLIKLEEIITQQSTLESKSDSYFMLDKTEFNLSDLCKAIVTQMETTAIKKNISIISDIKPGLTILADKGLIMRALVNLISHAFRCVQHNGLIKITLSESESIMQTDTSTQIDDNMSIILRILQGTDDTTAKSVSDPLLDDDIAMNVIIVPAIIKAHKGHLSIQDSEEHELEYIIYLPKS